MVKIIYLIALKRLSPLLIILPSIFASLIATKLGISDGSSLSKVFNIKERYHKIKFKCKKSVPEITKMKKTITVFYSKDCLKFWWIIKISRMHFII